jgi:streptogramin lyase
MKNRRLIIPAVVAGIATILVSSNASADYVFVTDNGANMVDAYSSAGGPAITVPITGLDGPTGLAFDSSGNLFVTNNGSGTIQEFGTGGNTTFATGLSNPRGLVFSGGNLYVANQSSGTISEFNSSGVGSTFVSGLSTPNGLAVDSLGNIYVAEGGGSNIIDEISPLGVVTTFATAANGLDNPNGLAFNAAGDLFVVNEGATSESIEEFDSTGTIHSTFTTTGLDGAKDLAFDSEGDLYVTNSLNGTITEYDPSGTESLFATDLAYPCFVITDPTGGNVINDTPEPSTYALLGAGLGLLVFLKRRKAAQV